MYENAACANGNESHELAVQKEILRIKEMYAQPSHDDMCEEIHSPPPPAPKRTPEEQKRHIAEMKIFGCACQKMISGQVDEAWAVLDGHPKLIKHMKEWPERRRRKAEVKAARRAKEEAWRIVLDEVEARDRAGIEKKLGERRYHIAKLKNRGSTPSQVPLMAALWRINRSAKRYRDAAQKCYLAGNHGLARRCKEIKLELYDLKSQALHYFVEDGNLEHAGYHQFEKNWAELLRGEGYTFHRPCPPPMSPLHETENLEMIEAKPVEQTEPKLKDSIFTIEQYLDGRPRVEVYRWLKIKKPTLTSWRVW